MVSLVSKAITSPHLDCQRYARKLARIDHLAIGTWNQRLFSATTSHTLGSSSDNKSLASLSPVQTSLALSVHFRQPDLGMKDYEILSRASAFLINVDPLEANEPINETSIHNGQGHVHKTAFPHLRENRNSRQRLLLSQEYPYEPASGPVRHPHQLNWLEFCPHNFRPKVHIVASSHVISPWLWPKYYTQDWLKLVQQEHVAYSLEVWGILPSENTNHEHAHDGKTSGSYRPLAKFALNPYPIHHPNKMDLAIIHLKQEDTALNHIMSLGVKVLNLPTMYEFENSTDPVYQPEESVLLQGYQVYDQNKVDQETLSSNEKTEPNMDDVRSFHPYSSLGSVTIAYPDRFLAKTKGGPLPEGLCGGPVIKMPTQKAMDGSTLTTSNDEPLFIRGVVEGIVPLNHENTQMAGLASFIPSYRVREFIDFSERIMLEKILEPDLYKRVVDMKEQRVSPDVSDIQSDELPDDPELRAGLEGVMEGDSETPHIDREYQDIIASLHKNHSPEEVDAILATVERERQEVIEILEKTGGDVDDVIAEVRKRTYEEKDRVMQQLHEEMQATHSKTANNLSDDSVTSKNENTRY